jgi:hypothetical protein
MCSSIRFGASECGSKKCTCGWLQSAFMRHTCWSYFSGASVACAAEATAARPARNSAPVLSRQITWPTTSYSDHQSVSSWVLRRRLGFLLYRPSAETAWPACRAHRKQAQWVHASRKRCLERGLPTRKKTTTTRNSLRHFLLVLLVYPILWCVSARQLSNTLLLALQLVGFDLVSFRLAVVPVRLKMEETELWRIERSQSPASHDGKRVNSIGLPC